MQKYLLLLFLFICASCIGSKNGILEQNKTFDIIIDPDRFTDDLDLSCILTDSIEIIKLETSDECLIGEIKKYHLPINLFLFLILMLAKKYSCLIKMGNL